MFHGDRWQGRSGMSEYSTSCIDIRADDLLISADSGVGRGQAMRLTAHRPPSSTLSTTAGGHLGDRLDCVESLKLPVLIPVIRQVQFAAVVKLVRTMLCTWGRGRPWGLVWCSKEAMTQCWGLTGANRVRPVPCMNSRTA